VGKNKGNPDQKKGAPSAPANNVVNLASFKCAAEDCNLKSRKFGFCEEHYEQFKFGLIKKDGTKPSDYTEKFKHYEKFQAQKKHAA